MIVYLDGRFVPRDQAKVSVEDRGFLFADAIYEVVRFFRGRAYRLEEHLHRMREGLAAIRIEADPGFFPEVARRLLAENELAEKDALVYAQISRGVAPRTHAFPPAGTKPTVFALAWETDPSLSHEGGRAILLEDVRWARCDIKSVMLLPNVLGAQRAREAGAIDAIFVRGGLALEGTKANLFSVVRGGLRTAPNGPHILPGVTRGAVLEAAQALHIPIEERALTVEEIYASDELFLASTSLWTYPIVAVEDRPIGTGRPGPIAARIREVLLKEFEGREDVRRNA